MTKASSEYVCIGRILYSVLFVKNYQAGYVFVLFFVCPRGLRDYENWPIPFPGRLS